MQICRIVLGWATCMAILIQSSPNEVVSSYLGHAVNSIVIRVKAYKSASRGRRFKLQTVKLRPRPQRLPC